MPDLKYATPSVIFEYISMDSLPSSRLSIFIESSSDVRRYEKITVKSNQTGFIWDVDNVIKIKASDKMYAGYNNLIVPYGEKLPLGEYNVIYTNADLETVETIININYEPVFYETVASEVPELMKRKFAKKYIAIYDKENRLIHYGERTDQLGDNRKIWNKYRTAAYFNEIWALPNNTVMCILPAEDVVPNQN